MPPPRLFTSIVLLFSGALASAQHSIPDTLYAMHIHEPVIFDGALSETFWQQAWHITNFTQRDPHVDSAATDHLDVAVVYDDLALYVGAICSVTDIDRLQAKYMQRDFNWGSDDNFQFVISTFNDHRNGYLFVTNPNGARGDGQVSGFGDLNSDWNGVWDVQTSCTPEGWSAEFRIPFNTLQFRRDTAQVWGINFERNVRCKNEQVNWQGWGRDKQVENLANCGTLLGIRNIGYAKRFEFKPYGLGGFNQAMGQKDEPTGKIGADLNVNLTPTLKLNLTSNTDFAQVEVDRIPVNLTRFNLYYPEKRAFFLEGSEKYEFYLGNSNYGFYTRRIGIEALQPVPILAGARLFGKVGHNNIGFLSTQTGAVDSVPTTNNTVLRYNYDVGAQSHIGGIITSKINSDLSSQIVGVDGSYITAKFLGSKVLEVNATVAQSIMNGQANKDGLAYRVYADYPNDLMDHFIAISSIQKNFEPSLGFLQRGNYDAFNWHLYITPRWLTKYGVRKMIFSPGDLVVYREAGTSHVESFYNTSQPLGFLLKSGDSFGLNLKQSYDDVQEPFNLSDDITIATQAYHMHATELYFESFEGRRVRGNLSPSWGTYYGSTITTLPADVTVNVNKHCNITVDYTWNRLRFPATELKQATTLETNELAVYPSYSFTTRLTLSIFGQWNSLDDLVRINARLHWIPKIGSDLFLVFDEGGSPVRNFDVWRPTSRSLVGKLVWRFAF